MELMVDVQLQEDLHAAQLTMAGQENEISALKSELDARAMDPDKRILELQREVGGLKMIAGELTRLEVLLLLSVMWAPS